MTNRFLRVRLSLIMLAALAGVLLVTVRGPAEPTLAKEDKAIAMMVCKYLQLGHLNKPEINDEVSRRLFHKFLKGLDPTKSYFLKSDIDEFKKNETELDDQLLAGDLKFPYAVYERYLKRLGERLKLVEEFVAAKHDFTVKESIDTNYDALDYPKNDEEVRERWRKRVKFDLLMERVAEKPVSEEEAKTKVLKRYQGLLRRWKQVDHADLLEIYLTDLTTSIDPHSTYMSPNTLDDFAISMSLKLDGIGAVLRSENGTTTIVEIVPGGAAAKDGHLKPNDKIVGVAQGDNNFVDAVEMKLQDVVKMIRGTRGTKVQLKVIPVGKIEPVVYELTRQKIELKSQEARGDIVEDGKKADGNPYKIGVIDLPSFYADTSGKDDKKSATEDVRRILKEFKEKKVDAVVLDLRRNGGGLLTEALSLTGLFIDQGPVVQVKGSQGKVQHKDDPEAGTDYDGPLVLLVSRFSASASEILAGAMQDYGRALIVGDASTFGKGTVQTVVDLGGPGGAADNPKLGALKLTIQQFYRVNGDSTQARGVAADVVLPSLTEHLGAAEKDQEHSLAFDKVPAIKHAELDLVPEKLKTVLKERSAARVKESTDFTKLAKEIELFKVRKDRKSVTLNEKELREQLAKDDANKIDEEIKDLAPPETSGGTAEYKFKRNYVNNEILKIAEDLTQGKKLLSDK